LARSGLRPGKDFHLLVIGLDPKDSAAEARAFTGPQIDAALAPAVRILTGSAQSVAAATDALGYRYVYDRANDQFAHPTVAFVVTGKGALSAVLSAVGLDGDNVRLALVSAGKGAIGTAADQLRLLCYCYDPETGIYSASISRLIDAGALLTALALAAGVLWLKRREVRQGRA
jgi:protein SCO1/2